MADRLKSIIRSFETGPVGRLLNMTDFVVVALHLQKQAMDRRVDIAEADLFARSAYNRYYYANFLLVRTMIKSFDSKWTAEHAAIPDLLKGKITRQILKGAKKAREANDFDTAGQCEQARSAAADLSDILKVGYIARCIADYNPEMQVVFDDHNRFSLNSINITNAHDWPGKASVFIDKIEKAWRQIDV